MLPLTETLPSHRRNSSTPSRITAVAALALTGLVACSSSPAPADTGTPTETQAAPSNNTSDLNGTLAVFAAASLSESFDDLLADFGAEHPGVSIEPAVYDGSSTLVTQLIEGAPADVLATADEATMERLVESGINSDTPELFATNTLVIAVPVGNPKQVTGLADLADLTFVICAPEVPCGAAAGRLFEAEQFSASPISEEQNVSAVAQRVASGEVDAGLVYTTDIASRADQLEAVTPGGEPVVNSYPIVTLDGDNPVAQAFVDYVHSDAGQRVLAGYGFGTP